MDDTPAPRKTLSLKGAVRPIVEIAPPDEFFSNPRRQRTRLFLAQILR